MMIKKAPKKINKIDINKYKISKKIWKESLIKKGDKNDNNNR